MPQHLLERLDAQKQGACQACMPGAGHRLLCNMYPKMQLLLAILANGSESYLKEAWQTQDAEQPDDIQRAQKQVMEEVVMAPPGYDDDECLHVTGSLCSHQTRPSMDCLYLL